MSNPVRLASRRIIWRAVGIGLASWIVAVLVVFGLERLALRTSKRDLAVGDPTFHKLYVFKAKAIDRPPTVEAGASGLRPDEEVIGVVVDGEARAYRLLALRDRARHVVNDIVRGVPVTVTYCDTSNCVRAFRGTRGSAPLGVSVAGIYEGKDMVLDVDGTLFSQISGKRLAESPGPGPAEIPLEGLATARTTWREWKQIHPETAVYEGLP